MTPSTLPPTATPSPRTNGHSLNKQQLARFANGPAASVPLAGIHPSKLAKRFGWWLLLLVHLNLFTSHKIVHQDVCCQWPPNNETKPIEPQRKHLGPVVMHYPPTGHRPPPANSPRPHALPIIQSTASTTRWRPRILDRLPRWESQPAVHGTVGR